ncbi:hypothetical protein ACKI1O_08290 [Streptomyces scabiei]
MSPRTATIPNRPACWAHRPAGRPESEHLLAPSTTVPPRPPGDTVEV